MKSLDYPLRSYELRCQMQKMGWLGVVRGHSRSWLMPPFDRVPYDFLFDLNRNDALSFAVFEI